MSYSVAWEVGEIGIRMALGAQRGAVVWLVLRRVLLLAGAGLAISVPAALVASQAVKSFRSFSRQIVEDITPIGIVITKFQSNSTTHVNVSDNLCKEGDAPVFQTKIRQADQSAAAAEFQPGRRTLKQKYGYGDLAERYIDLAREFLAKLEID